MKHITFVVKVTICLRNIREAQRAFSPETCAWKNLDVLAQHCLFMMEHDTNVETKRIGMDRKYFLATIEHTLSMIQYQNC